MENIVRIFHYDISGMLGNISEDGNFIISPAEMVSKHGKIAQKFQDNGVVSIALSEPERPLAPERSRARS